MHRSAARRWPPRPVQGGGRTPTRCGNCGPVQLPGPSRPGR
jgi:hypothetical protein